MLTICIRYGIDYYSMFLFMGSNTSHFWPFLESRVVCSSFLGFNSIIYLSGCQLFNFCQYWRDSVMSEDLATPECRPIKTQSRNNNFSKLLIPDRPLQVLPSLAVLIGLNEAIVLQQIHYWLSNELNNKIIDGKKWVYNTYEEWGRQFPFWSCRTIQRTMLSLENKN